MTRFGYTLMTEQNGPKDLVLNAISAEDRGFDFEVASDHFSPWLMSQGHAPNAWPVLGAVAQVTDRVDLFTYVTCPTMRYHPAIVAQQAATVQLLADGRFTLGLGSGENLNEHVVGKGWPAVDAAPGDAARGHRDHPCSCSTATWSTGAATTSKWTRRDCGTCPTSRSRSVSRWRGDAGRRQVRPAGRPSDRGRAGWGPCARVACRAAGQGWPGRPGGRADPDLLGPRSGRGHRARARSVPLVRRRLEGQCRLARHLPASPAPPSSSGLRTSRTASPAGRTSTRSSKPYGLTGKRDSPTSPWCRSAVTAKSEFLKEAAEPLLAALRSAARKRETPCQIRCKARK